MRSMGSGDEVPGLRHGSAVQKRPKADHPVGVAGLRKNDPALTYFRAVHYHRLRLLDCRVRKGNGYFQTDMGTGSCLENGFGLRGWWIRGDRYGSVE